jgi:mycothiol synthase
MTDDIASPRWCGRPWNEASGDVTRLSQFVGECWRAEGDRLFTMHFGDVTWQRYMLEDHIGQWTDHTRIWEDAAGAVVGFATYYPKDSLMVPVIDSRRDDGADLLREMWRWAEQGLGSVPGIELFADDPLVEAVKGWGFAPSDDPPMILNHRALDALPARAVPTGFAMRTVGDPDEYGERVDIHREAFDPSRVTLPAYERLRQAPGYDPELDLICVAPDGRFAAYCIAWFDPVSRTGEFEPVGARAAFRRRGLTRAVLIEGMHRLRDRGATHAVVNVEASNRAARALYASAGFEERRQWVTFRKTDD